MEILIEIKLYDSSCLLMILTCTISLHPVDDFSFDSSSELISKGWRVCLLWQEKHWSQSYISGLTRLALFSLKHMFIH